MSKVFSLSGWLIKQDAGKRYPLYIGIDPGVTGAIAFYNRAGHTAVDIPTYTVKGSGKMKSRSEYDLAAIEEMFGGVQGFRDCIRAVVEITLPHAPTGKWAGSKSPWNAYRVGMGYYMWPLALRMKGIKVYEVHPNSWKSVMGLNSNKSRSLRRARRYFPDAEIHLKKHHNRAEALMLARYLENLTKPEKEDDSSERRTSKGDLRRRRKRKV